LLPLTWIRAAQDRTLAPIGPNELGLDVGASDKGDPSCLGHRRGPVFRVLYEERQPDTMKTTGRLIQALQNPAYGAAIAKVDYIGVGRGVVDRAREQGLPVYPISVGESSTVYSCRLCKHEWDQALLQKKRQQNVATRCPSCGSDQIWTVFANLLSQFWWAVRGLFERGEIDIDSLDEQLAEELLTMRWEPNSKGQTVVRYHTDFPSPNRADALLMAYAPVQEDTRFDYKAVGMTSEVTW
jgi:DNA-directed RNA polymerase subunit RPC12/RpoP